MPSISNSQVGAVEDGKWAAGRGEVRQGNHVTKQGAKQAPESREVTVNVSGRAVTVRAVGAESAASTTSRRGLGTRVLPWRQSGRTAGERLRDALQADDGQGMSVFFGLVGDEVRDASFDARYEPFMAKL